MHNSVMILISLWLPSGFANFLKKTNFLIEVFPFRGLLLVGGFDCLKEPRSLFAVWEGHRRTRVGRHRSAGGSLRVAGRRRGSFTEH